MKVHTPTSKFKRTTLFTSIALGLLATPYTVSAQDSQVEEVIVTGSYIRRSEGLTAASPITQITAEDLEAEGTMNMAQVVVNQTFNNGTGTTESIQAGGSNSRSAAFNLRGLGSSATLQLVDGKRTTNGNVQRLLPGIAIERMDIVTDGAAALYGTDAVAGVVNMLPYKSYDGFKLEHFNEQDSRGDFRDQTTSFLWGRELGDGVDLVVSGSYRANGTLQWTDRPKLVRSGLTHNSGANPTNYNVPQRDENGVLTGASVSTPEPICGTDPNNDPTVHGSDRFGTLALGRCWAPFADTRDFMGGKSVASLFSNLTWEVNEDLTLSGQLLWGRQIATGRQNAGNPGARFGELPIVRGELPGNPYRARSGDGRDLFAQPRLDTGGAIVTDGYGNPLPLRDANGVVVLAANQFAPLSADAAGGVPFNEDVPMSSSWLPFHKGNTLSSRHGEDGINRADLDDRDTRLAFTADFTVPFIEGWEGTAFYTYGESKEVDVASQTFSFSAVEQGLNCDVITDVDACFNPFATDDPRYLNSVSVADAIATRERVNNTDTLQTFDLILNGEISPGGFELPGGPISAAFGYQRRDETDENVPTPGVQMNDQLIGIQVPATKNSRTSDSYFAEFSLPVLSNVELSAAVRDEQFSTGQGKVVTKFGIIYTPADWVTLRATQGEAFIAPTLPQLNNPESCGLSNVDDLFTPFSGFITSCSSGNPNLASETSDSLSIGVDLDLFDDLTLSLTYSETDFVDRIVGTTSQDIVRNDYANFQLNTGFTPTDANPYPSVAVLEAWVANPLSDKRIARDPLDIQTTTRIQQSDSNASSMLVKALDLQLAYDFTLDGIGLGNIGNFRAGLQATHMDTYEFQLSDTDIVREAVGNQNNDFGAVPPIPEWRANANLSWNLGNHSVNTTVRYIDEVVFDANEFSFQVFFPGNTWHSTDVIRAWTTVDMFYAYRDLELFDGTAAISFGARNLFDREAQRTGMIAGAVTSLQNPLGRVLYARVNYEF